MRREVSGIRLKHVLAAVLVAFAAGMLTAMVFASPALAQSGDRLAEALSTTAQAASCG